MAAQQDPLKKAFNRCISGEGSKKDHEELLGFKSFDVPHIVVDNTEKYSISASDIDEALMRR